MRHIHVHLHSTRDEGTSEGAKKAAQTRKAHGGYKSISSGGQKFVGRGTGTWKPLGAYSVHKWEQGVEPSISNIVHHTNSESAANKHANNLWEKTGEPHIVRHTQYLRD